MPSVSVLMPMRNAAHYVREAVGSVLGQAGVELELIVVDDGSTDDSARIVRDLPDARIRLLSGLHHGIAAAVNTALAEARGELVARCDADDILPSGRLARHAAVLAEHPEFAAVCGSLVVVDAEGRRLIDGADAGPAREITDELRSGTTRTHFGAYTVRTEAVRQLGGCRPYFVTAEDIDLQLRLGNTWRVWFEAQPAYCYRIHDVSITHVQSDVARVFFEGQARRFQAQRLAGNMDDLQLGHPPSPPDHGQSRPGSIAEQVQGLLEGQAWRYHRAGHRTAAILTGLRACLARPLSLHIWKSLLALAFKACE